MGGGSKKGNDSQDIPEIDPNALIQQAIQANRVGLNTPYGSQAYATDAAGNTTLNTQLTPQMQQILNEQMARASGPSSQYQLPSQNADVLNGLNTRLNQRYGIAMPPPPTSSGTPTGPGGGGAPGPGTTPQQPPIQQPPINNGGVTSGPGVSNPYENPLDYPIDPDYIPRGQAAGGAHLGDEFVGGMCVAVDSWMPGGVKADQVNVGDVFPVHTPELGFHDHPVMAKGFPMFEPVVQLTTEGGAILRCSESTPFTLTSAQSDLEEGHTKFAPEMLGEKVFVHTQDGVMSDVVKDVSHLGKGWVQPLSFDGRSFPAGDTPSKLIYSHNIVKDNAANVSGAIYGFGDTGMSGSNNLWGAIDQSNMNAAQVGLGPYGGGMEQQQNFGIPLPGSGPDPNAQQNFGLPAAPATSGGYLGSGSYSGMGGGLSAARGDSLNGFGLPASPDLAYDNSPEPISAMPNLPGEPHWNALQRAAAAILPGNQSPGGGVWPWIRGAVQGASGNTIPIATGWDIVQKGVDKFGHRNK